MKAQRQAKIVEIISNANVETQEQLLQALTDQGFSSTQATISRDIKELRIVKELTSLGTYRYCVPEKDAPPALSDRLNNIFRECVISVDYAAMQPPLFPERLRLLFENEERVSFAEPFAH